MMSAEAKRAKVAAKYREIIGRNLYSQALRDYCYKPYRGRYYSDCSSSVSYAYREAGVGFGILNTAGMYTSAKFRDVPVTIRGGQITEPERLRVGDLLLYAGTDGTRPGCVGHVEMVGEIAGGKVILYGHGSGSPKKTEMTAKNASRFASRTGTKVGNKGLIRVRRFIPDDECEGGGGLKVKSGVWNLRKGPGTGFEVVGHVNGGDELEKISIDGWVAVEKDGDCVWISEKGLEAEA